MSSSKMLGSTNEELAMHLAAALQSAANLLGIKFLDHLALGSPDCEEGRGYVSVMERGECCPANEKM